MAVTRLCEKCDEPATSNKSRFCKLHRGLMLDAMEESGYLTPRVFGHAGDGRSSEHKEVIRETKFGRDG